MSVLNINHITFTQFRFFFWVDTIVTGRKTDAQTGRVCSSMCLSLEGIFLFKGLVFGNHLSVPSSSNADSSLWYTDHLPPPSTPMKLLQDLPGPAVCWLGPPPTHPGPNRCSPHPLSLFQRSLSAPPSGNPREGTGAGKLNPNSEQPHPGTKQGKGKEVNALPAKARGIKI